MSKAKSKPTRTILWEEEILKYFVLLLVGKLLNFLWKRAKAKVRFEGQVHFTRRVFVMFGVPYLSFMFGSLMRISEPKDAQEYSDLLKRFLRLHVRYHQLTGRRTCNVCFLVAHYRGHFQKYVLESKLYPPFKP
jgi:hypothetical protein